MLRTTCGVPTLAVVANIQQQTNALLFRDDACSKTCSSGTFASVGASSCQACAAGQYSVLDGAETCDLCPLGTYVDVPGELS